MPRPARPWFRVYSEALDNPKLQRLNGNTFKAWFNVACLANVSEPRGTLPAIKDIAFRLRLSDRQAQTMVRELVDARLLDETPSGYAMHDWDGPNGWQYESDARATEGRQKRGDSAAESPQFRSETLSDAPPRADTEQKQSRTESETEADTEGVRAAVHPDLDVSDEHGFALEYIHRYERKNARPPSPNEKAAARALERDFGSERCMQIAADHDWEMHPNWLRRALNDPNRGRKLQIAGVSHGRRQNSGDDIAAAWEDYDRRQREG